ncbi:CIC11C00000004847 [Sungouiella intermedia]|uniref:CIC11C00000004847 n=1 Tax=Sungouiella intermedia TaxID=45354 RepID=A0A1L0DID5_9ASCO|nr:CIC11C00000004847 [[Candida] intermedia]
MSKALNRNKLGQHSVFHFRGILSHLMMVNGDPSSVIVWDYIFSLKDDQMSLKTVYAENKVVAREHVEALDRQSMNYFGPKYIKRLTTSPNEDEVVSVRQAISRNACRYLLFTMFTGELLYLKAKVQKSYRALLISDTGYKQPEELKILNVSTKKDIATLATLIIVLRFAFLSLTNPFGGESVRTDMNKAEIDDLSQNPICLDLINCADRILRELDISVDICDETMQAMFLSFSTVLPRLRVTFTHRIGISELVLGWSFKWRSRSIIMRIRETYENGWEYESRMRHWNTIEERSGITW